MTKLSVNVNKIALLRNSRGHNLPDLIRIALDCVDFGAEGITVHPRPDGRHIRKPDVFELANVLTVEFNIEGYPSEEFMQLIEAVSPTQVTLVPDPPEALTSNAGWDTLTQKDLLLSVIPRLKATGARVSLFVDPKVQMVSGAHAVGADRIELYTEPYAQNYSRDREAAVAPYFQAAARATALGLGVNAGHDLNLENLRFLIQKIPAIQEVSIGHALISDALYLGLKDTIRRYRECLRL